MSYQMMDGVGAVLAFLSTVLCVRANILSWPLGLLASSVDFYLYFKTGLYADMMKEVIYFAMIFYGWYEWLRGGENHSPLPISRVSWNVFQRLLLVMVIFSVITIGILVRFTNSQVPYWDATTTVIGLTAMWMTSRKILECWILWFLSDMLYIGLYFYKNLSWHGLLFSIYLIFAMMGFWHWTRLMKKQEMKEVENGVYSHS